MCKHCEDLEIKVVLFDDLILGVLPEVLRRDHEVRGASPGLQELQPDLSYICHSVGSELDVIG